jgi:hypothetical protein
VERDIRPIPTMLSSVLKEIAIEGKKLLTFDAAGFVLYHKLYDEQNLDSLTSHEALDLERGHRVRKALNLTVRFSLSVHFLNYALRKSKIAKEIALSMRSVFEGLDMM